MWGLTPQPCYDEYREVLKNTEPENWKPEWFGKLHQDGRWEWYDFRRGKHITWQQCAVLEGVRRAVDDYGNVTNKIAVKSGNGIGKSCLSGWLVPWFLFAFYESKVPCTAPTATQMDDVLWAAVSTWINKMPEVYKQEFDWSSKKIKITTPLAELDGQSSEEWYARARTARKENPEAFSGIHAPYVMAVADEASGVPDEIYKVGAGIKTSPFWLFLMFSNPTRLVGYFRDAFNNEDVEGKKVRTDWRQYTFDSRQSPVVDWTFVTSKMDESGYDSDDFRVFVEGRFPKADSMDDQGYVPLFTLADLEGAMHPDDSPPIKIQGVDPSGEGHDKTAFVGRNAYIAKILAEEAISTPKSVAARTATFIAQYGIESRKTVIDNFGSGANVGQELALQGFEVYPLNVGEPASDKKFMNKRAELCWKMREWVKRGGMLVRDKRWMELLNLRYRYNESGRLQIMSKEKMAKDGIPSPNFADAFMLTFAVLDMPNARQNRSKPKNNDVYD